MKKAIGIVLMACALLSAGVVAQVDLKEFPAGTTEMTWQLSGRDVPPNQTLYLSVIRVDDEFAVELRVSARGAAEELGLLGFLGSALGVQAPGTDVDLSVLSMVMRRRDVLRVGEDYQLPGGYVFRIREEAEIAGVLCLIGEFGVAGGETRTELGIAVDDPVYFMPLLRITRRGELQMEMELIEYVRP